jgi:hypothetical protein
MTGMALRSGGRRVRHGWGGQRGTTGQRGHPALPSSPTTGRPTTCTPSYTLSNATGPDLLVPDNAKHAAGRPRLLSLHSQKMHVPLNRQGRLLAAAEKLGIPSCSTSDWTSAAARAPVSAATGAPGVDFIMSLDQSSLGLTERRPRRTSNSWAQDSSSGVSGGVGAAR